MLCSTMQNVVHIFKYKDSCVVVFSGNTTYVGMLFRIFIVKLQVLFKWLYYSWYLKNCKTRYNRIYTSAHFYVEKKKFMHPNAKRISEMKNCSCFESGKYFKKIRATCCFYIFFYSLSIFCFSFMSTQFYFFSIRTYYNTTWYNNAYGICADCYLNVQIFHIRCRFFTYIFNVLCHFTWSSVDEKISTWTNRKKKSFVSF